MIRNRLPQLRIYLRHLRLLDPAGHDPLWTFVLDNCVADAVALMGDAFPSAQFLRVDDGGPAYHRERARPYARMAMLRNLLRAATLDAGADGLLSIDSDIVVTPELVSQLLAPGRPWVAAIVDNSKGQGRKFNVMHWAATGSDVLERRPLDRERGGPADLVGAVCFYRRDLLEAAAFASDRSDVSEDVGFARAARTAGYAGWYIPMELEHLMTEAQVGAHWKHCSTCREAPGSS